MWGRRRWEGRSWVKRKKKIKKGKIRLHGKGIC